MTRLIMKIYSITWSESNTVLKVIAAALLYFTSISLLLNILVQYLICAIIFK